MHLLKMRPAGVPVNILFCSSIGQDFVEEVAQSWGSLQPELRAITEPDDSEPTVAVGYEEYRADGDLPEIAPARFAYLQVAEGSEDVAAERLTVEVTLKMLEQLSGEKSLFHAAALGHQATQTGMILIGPSGRGKTTASRFLGQHFLYLSDETAVIDRSYRMHPYPKPLSVIVEQGKPKQQINPLEEGMNALSPTDSEIELAHMILLNRQEGISEPYFERVSLADALLSMVSETSGLDVSQQGLAQLNELVNHCGGVLRINYTEISDTLPLFTSLFEGEVSIEGTAWEPETVDLLAAHEGSEIFDRTQIARAVNTSVLEVGDRILMVSNRS